MDCYYYSSDGAVTWGLGSANEMCIDFLYYYPKYAAGLYITAHTYCEDYMFHRVPCTTGITSNSKIVQAVLHVIVK